MEFKSKDFTDAKRVLKIRGLTVGLTGRPNADPVLLGSIWISARGRPTAWLAKAGRANLSPR